MLIIEYHQMNYSVTFEEIVSSDFIIQLLNILSIVVNKSLNL